MFFSNVVDNLFEEDAGFWPTLMSLIKRARCPVFLTANVIPKWFFSSTISFKHVMTARPSPDDCATRMMKILKEEQIGLNSTDGTDCANRLAAIAELCHCDLRRLIHELQLASFGLKGAESSHLNKAKVTLPETTTTIAAATTTNTTLSAQSDAKIPDLFSVSPRFVSPDTCTLLTIKGKNFNALSLACHDASDTKGFPVKVFVGKQRCPTARVVDECTILAVCPPFRNSPLEDMEGMNKPTKNWCLSSRFAPIVVESCCPIGIISSTRATPLSSITHPHPTKLNVEYKARETNINSDEEECEFGENDHNIARNNASTGTVEDWSLDTQKIETMATKLLHEGLMSFEVSGDTSKLCSFPLTKMKAPDKESVTTMKDLALDFALTSDAAILGDEFVCGGIPHLAGASRGFGYSLTAVPADGNGASVCSEERLIACGWKDTACFYGDCDAYMTIPASARERLLLKRSEALGRGLSSTPVYKSVSEATATDQEETPPDTLDLTMWSPPTGSGCVLDEDMYIPNRLPTALMSLKELLIASRGHCIANSNYNLVQDRTIAMAEKLGELLDTIQGYDPRMAKNRGLGYSSFEYSCHFLDYLPLLRVMAKQEEEADIVFQEALKVDPDACASISYGIRRNTRRSATQPKREHYFESLLMNTYSRDEVAAIAQELGRQLSDSLIVYQKEG